MLGALALSDIGTIFPDTDPKYKDADSTVLLKHVYDYVRKKGYDVENIDSNIIAQDPKMMPYIPKMKEILCRILGLDEGRLSIKAKSNEKLDAVGEGRAIKAQVVALMKKIN